MTELNNLPDTAIMCYLTQSDTSNPYSSYQLLTLEKIQEILWAPSERTNNPETVFGKQRHFASGIQCSERYVTCMPSTLSLACKYIRK
ncbi:hypothetical protein TNIN_292431 [Trichonephila inaurata madagascariensis]|uniref:Uncharacterized protein n=1 Tax=Trichonephila inaurata madagascariensis TaxID=2747483 RepID=A0A8X7BVB7_9ARAC|nr:hypothetical protein TNIN_292431 [Trichonephila inaurata madagascariensis]